ncbi:uncharacterized protein LOC135394998 isoform X1 [Ornithodoros turicata]|uniref:uncharacterized protein LOC135394998 isoform X1 n=1 Tax=Ornithodoros turicata TaxID=34597 RepID=UPI00313A4080
MATKPTRPAPPPPVPKHGVKLPVQQGTLRDTNNNKHESKCDKPPSRPTVIRPKIVQTPKKKPPPRPPPPKTSNGSSVHTNSSSGHNSSLFGPLKVNSGTCTNDDSSKSSTKLFSRAQFNLFGSSNKHHRSSQRKGPAPKRPHGSTRTKGSAPPPPPHRTGPSTGLASDGTASLISFDSPPASPTGSRASWSSGVSSQSGGPQPCLLDLDIPPLQEQPWGTTLAHSQTLEWGSGPARDSGAGDSAQPPEDPWSFPHSGSMPALATTAGDNSSPTPSWSFPDNTDSHSSPDSGTWEEPPHESWSPPPPLHPPPAPPSVDDSDVVVSPLAVAVCNYQATCPEELSFRVQDLIVLLSEEGATKFRGRCGDEEGLVLKHCVDVIHPLTTKTDEVLRKAGNNGEQYCTALYNFVGESPDELTIHKGDVIRILGTLDGNWIMGTLDSRKGMFPANFVQMGSAVPCNPAEKDHHSKGCPVIALHTFQAEQNGDLGFCEGDTITVLSRINKDWLYGELGGREGQFPASFVQPISGSRSQKNSDCSLYKVLYVFDAQHHDELSLKVGSIVEVTQKINDDWWQGRLLGNSSGKEGMFPASFVQKLN